MRITSDEFGEINIAAIKALNEEEYQVVDANTIAVLERNLNEKISTAFVVNVENDWYITIYIEIPEEYACLCEDVFVFGISIIEQ